MRERPSQCQQSDMLRRPAEQADERLSQHKVDSPVHGRNLGPQSGFIGLQGAGRIRRVTTPPISLFGVPQASAKAYQAGTHRARSPRSTWEEYRRFMPRAGITRLANLTGLDWIGLPVFTAIRPNSRSLATSQGKGEDADSARVSALMESLELWHAENIDAPLRYASSASLRREAEVIDVERLPLRTGAILRPEEPLPWIQGWDLMRGRACWVPFSTVSADFVGREDPRDPFHRTSNGLASGNHLLEAIVHGLCEVIERDAETLWRLGEDLRRVDLSTVQSPFCRRTIDLIERAGVYVATWEITSDVGIPAYACALLDPPDGPRWRVLGVHDGFGCHLSADVALMRALSEAVQTRVTYVSGSRDDLFRHEYARAYDETTLRDVWDEIRAPEAMAPFAGTSLATDSFEGDVAVLLSALKRAGVESAVAVDLTKPELALPVAKVLVPGLEGVFDDMCARGERARRLSEASPS